VGFGNVDHPKFRDVLEFIIHRLQFANLAKKGRSRIGTKNQYYRSLAAEFAQVKSVFAIGRCQLKRGCELTDL
jgi:hypothetical protein